MFGSIAGGAFESHVSEIETWGTYSSGEGWTWGTLILRMKRVIGTGATCHWRGIGIMSPYFPYSHISAIGGE